MVRLIHGRRALSLGLRRRFFGLARDRRGVTAMLFAVTAVAVLGVVGLATEAGAWYLARSAADSTADAAAAAAALAVFNGADYLAAATDSASGNGYATGATVTVNANHPPATGSYTTNAAAAEVLINVTFTPILSNLFTGLTPSVASRSVAMVEPVGTACVLSTIGPLLITQKQNSVGCMYASNASDTGSTTAVEIPSARINAYGVTSVGSCTGCDNARNVLWRPATFYQPPTINPYTAIDTLALPTSFTSISVPSTLPASYMLVPATATGTFNTGTTAAATYSWTTGQQYYAYTSNLVIPAGTTVTLVPGTYFFVNASLTLNGGTIQCKVSTSPGAGPCNPGTQGVTIILTGNPSTSVGTLTIASAASVNLGALASQGSVFANSSGLGAAYNGLNGILFYRSGQASGENVGAPGVDITGKTTSPFTVLNGGMYFPNSYVSYGANDNVCFTNSCQPSCAVIIAGYLSLTNAASTFISGNCSVYGTFTPEIQAVRVVE